MRPARDITGDVTMEGSFQLEYVFTCGLTHTTRATLSTP